MSASDVERGDALHPGHPVVVDRYTPDARANHWLTAICLVLLALSGLAMFNPSLFFSFSGLFFRFYRLNLWRSEDTAWLAGVSDVLTAREERLPEVGKYNAGQKLVFWSMSLLIIILIVSGLIIWDQYFLAYTSIPTKRVALLVHTVAAVVIICVWIIHVYAAIWVRGTIGAMTRGRVTGGWAWRHHRRWLKALAARGGEDLKGPTRAG